MKRARLSDDRLGADAARVRVPGGLADAVRGRLAGVEPASSASDPCVPDVALEARATRVRTAGGALLAVLVLGTLGWLGGRASMVPGVPGEPGEPGVPGARAPAAGAPVAARAPGAAPRAPGGERVGGFAAFRLAGLPIPLLSDPARRASSAPGLVLAALGLLDPEEAAEPGPAAGTPLGGLGEPLRHELDHLLADSSRAAARVVARLPAPLREAGDRLLARSGS